MIFSYIILSQYCIPEVDIKLNCELHRALLSHTKVPSESVAMSTVCLESCVSAHSKIC